MMSVIATEALCIHIPGLHSQSHSCSGFGRFEAPQNAAAPTTAESTDAAALNPHSSDEPETVPPVPDSGQQQQEQENTMKSRLAQQHQLELQELQPAAASPAVTAMAALQAGSECSVAQFTATGCASPDRQASQLAAACKEGLPAQADWHSVPGSPEAVEEDTPEAACAVWEHESAGHTPWATTAAEAAAGPGEEQAPVADCSTPPHPTHSLPQSASDAKSSLCGVQPTPGWVATQAAFAAERVARLAAEAELQRLNEAAQVRKGRCCAF